MSGEIVQYVDLVSDELIPADINPAAVYLASLSAGSVPAQRSALRKIAELVGLDIRTMNWGGLRYQHVQYIRARLQERYAATTANRILTALRRVIREGWKLGYIPEPEYRKMVDLDRIKSNTDDVEDALMGRALDQGEILSLMNVCGADTSIAGVRDAAIIALGYGLGLRRSEISKLELEHYSREKSTIKVSGGKGNKTRYLPINNGAQDALNDWLSIRGNAPGRVFWGVNRGGNLSSKKMNPRTINVMYLKRCTQANISDTNFHDLRRSFISDLLDRGIDVATIAKLAGHSNPTTTLRYDRRKMEVRRKAVSTLQVPYKRR